MLRNIQAETRELVCYKENVYTIILIPVLVYMLFYKKHDNDHILHILSCNIERDIDEKSLNGSKTSCE